MDKILSDNFGCQISERDGKLFLLFDGGHFLVEYFEFEISKEQAEKAMKSEQDAYEVILDFQLRNAKNLQNFKIANKS